ncbi:MAG: response regulator [Desulfamplus sp.]|nr:response regulator [Desulfamplus sp.]
MPDLILLDVMMPGMDGFEVCRTLRASLKGSRIPILFITALNEAEDRLKGFDAGGDDYSNYRLPEKYFGILNFEGQPQRIAPTVLLPI